METQAQVAIQKQAIASQVSKDPDRIAALAGSLVQQNVIQSILLKGAIARITELECQLALAERPQECGMPR